jgi:hypothetical protein
MLQTTVSIRNTLEDIEKIPTYTGSHDFKYLSEFFKKYFEQNSLQDIFS